MANKHFVKLLLKTQYKKTQCIFVLMLVTAPPQMLIHLDPHITTPKQRKGVPRLNASCGVTRAFGEEGGQAYFRQWHLLSLNFQQ